MMRGETFASRLALVMSGAAVTLLAVPALAADRAPVAVVWMGDADTVAAGAVKTVDDVNAALGRTRTARPIDSVEDRRTLVDGGPSTRVLQLLRRAEAAFVKLKYGDAAKDYEAAETILWNEVPLDFLRQHLGDVERNLLACYDQLGRSDDAARAAERLSWTAGNNEDMQRLIDKYRVSRAWQPQFAPVIVETDPPNAAVYRDLAAAGAAPQTIAGGDPSIDVVDVDAPGFRRAHRELRAGETMKVALAREDRLGVLVDQIRAQAPDAPPKDVAAVGKRVGATRVLVLLPDGPKKLLGRFLDVDHAAWATESVRVDSNGVAAMDKLAQYAAPAEPVPAVATAGNNAVAKPADKNKKKGGLWGKWYTWVAAGAVVALVGGLLIAQHVGSDTLNVTATYPTPKQ